MRKSLALLLVPLVAATFWGCGSNRDSGGNQTSPESSLANAPAVGSSSCQVCHSVVVPEWTGSFHQVAGDAAAGCEGCHGGGQYHKGVGPIPYPEPGIERCATCHEATSPGFLARHRGDDPATAYGADGEPVVEGYVYGNCLECHSQVGSPSDWAHHPGATDIHKQWAKSAHAGRIAAAIPDTATVWGHYDWDASSRASCARCHTATGAKNFLNAPTTYSAANNNFSHLEAGQNELLYCWGCHSNVATGALRNPGVLTLSYSNGASATFPNAGDSNVCIACHAGRESGNSIKNATGDFANLSFINSHYLAAGGMVFGETGFEFAGQDYTGWEDGQKYGRHGNVARAEFGTAGPCVTCHMTSAEPHKFEVVQKNAAGIITSVATTACDSCHGNMNAAWLEERKESFHEALEALKEALTAKGIYFYPAHPYFYTAPYVVGGTNTAFKNWEGVYAGKGKEVMGAAFNYNLIEHDPGAYAHNRTYALKLIVDSIDFLADGVVDGAGAFTINSASVDLLETAEEALAYTLEEKHHGGAVLKQANFTTDTSAYNVGCGDCHATNPIAGGSRFVTNGVIVDQFAESAHGDVLGEAWVHYDWRSSSRASCARCHTATGFVAKLGNESNTTNVFDVDNTDGVTDLNLPGEVLRCTACHTDIATGAVRAASAFTATYSNGATQAFPNVGASNLCVRCHGARESGDSIALDADADGIRSFLNSHYLAAGATVFAGGGYEFAGQNYANPAYFKHDVVGIATPGAPVATDAGPCAGCHMGTSANHTWEVVAKNDAGVITAINSEVCASCHAGNYALTPQKLEVEKEELHSSLAALEAALAAKGIYFYAAHPYFYTAPFVVGGTNTAFTNWAGVYGLANWKNTMGAAFNYNLLEHDPGAYAHNRFYTKRLIFDSIDFLDNGVFDGTINVTGEAAIYLDGSSSTTGVQRP